MDMTDYPDPVVLLVEDCQEDVEAIARAHRLAEWNVTLIHCWSGDEALDYLHRRGAYAHPARSPRPAFVLLDLNLPGTDGLDLLRSIKNVETLKSIPVAVMTTSSDERDILRSYQAGANCYLQKPCDSRELAVILRNIRLFWFETALLPRTE
jgi:DNA-binding response OmpR family regulator